MSEIKIITLSNLKYIIRYLKTKFIAPHAVCDAAGNDIQETYLKKIERVNEAYHAEHADQSIKATEDGLGRNIAETYVSAAGGKISGELHLETPADDDRSDKPATTSWVTKQISKAVPSKKTDGSMQTWDINVSGNAKTATAANTLGIHKILGATSDKPYAAMAYTDFTEMGVYEVFYASGNALPPDCNGDIWIFNLYHGDPKWASMIAVSPRVNQMYTGHFIDGKWNGWKKIANIEDVPKKAESANKVYASAASGTEAELVHGAVADDGFFQTLAGGNSGKNDAYATLRMVSKGGNGTISVQQWNKDNNSVRSAVLLGANGGTSFPVNVTAPTMYTNNWFRSQGNSGWYNENYGGGIFMSDTDWIRTFGSKNFYCDKEIRANKMSVETAFNGNLNGTATNANYINNDFKPMRMHWAGQNGQPTWLWGGNDGVNMYVYNPSNFNVNYAKTAGSVNAANVVGLSDFVNKIAGITPSTDTPLAPNYDANEHNKILRGNDITNYFTSGQMSAALQKGNFSNIYPGDMIIFPNEKEEGGYRTWIVGDCDYFWGNKESAVTKHHVLMANKFPIIHQKFVNLPGHKGYLDSDVWKNKLPAIFNAINSLFKGHILPHKELLVSRYSPSCDMSKNDEKGEYAATTVNLFSNTMLGIKDYNGRSETAVQIGNTAKTVSYFRMSPGSITPQHRDDQSTNRSLLRSVSYSNGAPWRNHIDYTGYHGGEGVGDRSLDYCYFVYFLLY